MKKRYGFYILLAFFAGQSFWGFGQVEMTKIRGEIRDSQSGEPVSFVNVVFKNTNYGAISDFEGKYFLQARTEEDTLLVSCVGYKPRRIAIKRGEFQTLNIELEADSYTLQEITVDAGENPAHAILRKIIANKKQNNPANQPVYQCEIYNKLQFDLNNVDEDLKKRRVFKQFQFIFDYIDTSTVTGKSYIPVFISETLSQYYYQKKPRRETEIILGNRIAGVENESITQFTGQMYMDANIYDNYLEIFDKSFVSPIADFGLFNYEYYLLDSSFIDNQWCYLMKFKPRRKQEFTFRGEFWVHDTTFAIKKVQGRMTENANINFINDLVINQEFVRVKDSVWMVKSEDVFADFNVGDKATGFFGRKYTSYRAIKLNVREEKKIFTNKAPEITKVEKNASKRSEDFWQEKRHAKLTQKEQNIYNMVDSIKNVPLFTNFVDAITLFVTGYYVRKNFEYGPYYTFYSHNPIEGHRIRFGGRTSNEFSTKIMFNGHIAYGFKDQRLKYGAGFLYMINKAPREAFGFQYKNDMEQLGQSHNAFMEDNILSTILARNPKYKMSMVEEYKINYEKEWFTGFSNQIQFKHRIIFPSDSIVFEQTLSGDRWSSLISSEIRLNTRYAFNEKFVYGEFERVSLGSEYPILNLDFTIGIKDLLGSDFPYYKLGFSIDYHFNINPIGRMNCIVETGKIWGDLPYPLLRLHEGNETYAFDDYAYNMLNYYEFVSDTYIGLYAEHHFNGFFLNRVPLFRRLKWREVIYGKALAGSLHSNTREIMDFPVNLKPLSKPYYEVGIGIENILKVIRIDALWRLSYLDQPNIQKFGIRAKLQIIL